LPARFISALFYPNASLFIYQHFIFSVQSRFALMAIDG
jgi:hypothetical protein